MTLGFLARAERRGLGLMSLDAMRHLYPEHVIVVDCGGPHAKHLAPFGSAPVVSPTSPDFEPAVKELLGHVDTLLLLETPYDVRVYEWARTVGVKTVCVAMPEYHIPERWQADVVVNPTPYLHERLPKGSLVLAWPTDLNHITYRPRTHIDTWLHVVGQPCARDRNGTELVLKAFAQMPDQQLVVRAQTDRHPLLRRRWPSNIHIDSTETTTVDALYRDADALIMPRRYAGQSLPMNEAQAAGLPLVCLDREPERNWTLPQALIPAQFTSTKFVNRSAKDVYPGPRDLDGLGQLDIADAHIADVVSTVQRVASDELLVRQLSNLSRDRACSRSWDSLGDNWRDLLA